MLSLSYDLHIHSCLSPCGDNESTPANIIGMAYVKGLDVVAITDHNSSKNCLSAQIVADAYGVCFIPGMELTTEEEVHVVCLFPNVPKAMAFDEYVNKLILPIPNDPEIFGEQLVVDEDDKVIAKEPILLINATSISFQEAFPLVESFGGVAFPAHIDKNSNSLLANLGFVPPDSEFNTIELKNRDTYPELIKKHDYLNKCRVLTNSDAHYLHDINEPVNFLHAEEKTPQAVINTIKSIWKGEL
ncbi:MAG: phosphoesterase [Clostridiales bacterium]|nr:phosphoesterase [Clostridiales bacterium]